MRSLLITLLALAVPASAQELVKNGDFETNALAPWTTSGHAFNPAVEKYDTAGRGPGLSFACSPGLQSTTSPKNPLILSQSGIISVPLLHELSFDFAAYIPPISISAAVPTADVYLDQQLLHSVQYTLSRANPKRQRVCIRYTPKSAGTSTLRISFDYKGVASSRSPRVYVDNISLRRATNPTFCILGERKLGTTNLFQVEGSNSAAFVVFMALNASPAPIPIPGFGGAYGLDLATTLPFFSGALDANGLWSQKVAIPNLPGIAGYPLHWQGLEASTAGVSFGLPSVQAFYQ